MPPPHLTKFTCLDCRSTFKRPTDAVKRNIARAIEIRTCPNCAGAAYLMSSDFRAPPKADDRAWAVVAFLVRSGFAYFRLYEDVPLSAFGHPMRRPKGLLSAQRRLAYPETLREAEQFVRDYGHLALPFVDTRVAPGG